MPSQPSRTPDLPRPVRSALAVELGLSRHQLAGPRMEHPLHGVVAPAGTLGEFEARCEAVAVGLPEGYAFTHTTAARLLGLPLPPHVDLTQLHVAVPAGCVVPDHRDVSCHGLWLPGDHVCEVASVRCTSAARTFLDLAASVRYDHLVALGDHALRAGLVTNDDLTTIVRSASRRRGVVGARRALSLLDARAESPPESLTRVWLVEAGLPEVTPQAIIRDESGLFVARVDLAIVRYKVAIEYQGSYHRDAEAFASDIGRRARLRGLGWLVVEVEARGMRSRSRVVGSVVDALRSRGWTGQPRPTSR